jgi:Arc/MetJ-type ribon-helix-helix transcriptional regulator
MNVQLDPRSEQLIERQLRAGRFHSAEEVVARALETLAEEPIPDQQAREKAVQDMKEFAEKHRITLDEGLTIRDLIREGRKY